MGRRHAATVGVNILAVLWHSDMQRREEVSFSETLILIDVQGIISQKVAIYISIAATAQNSGKLHVCRAAATVQLRGVN
jgi:hypothetical protein